MGKKEFILDQLAVCRNEESWIQPLSKALEGLSGEEASWKPESDAHSAAEIASHLNFYNNRWLGRFEGEIPDGPPDTNASTFMPLPEPVEENWRKLVKELDEGLARWQQLIEESNEESLDGQIPGFPEDAKWWEALSNLCTHNAYHIGQIIFVRKLQRKWKSTEI